MKCHQRKIREAAEQVAIVSDPEEPLKREAAAVISNAVVREITYAEAQTVILKYEWLGNMGTTARTFGLFFKHPTSGVEYLGGVACFGHPGSTAILDLCGKENADKVYWLARGACVHWAHPHSGSFLVTEACKQFSTPWETRFGETTGRRPMPAKFVFVATADSDAGEVGTIYQACNWIHVGKTTSDRMFNKPGDPPERAKSYRVLVTAAIRNRTGRSSKADASGKLYFTVDGVDYYCGDTLPDGDHLVGSDKYPFRIRSKYGKTKKEAEANRLAEVFAEGYVEVKGNPKYMYVGIYGDKRQRRELTAALLKKKKRMEYPKRGTVEGDTVGASLLVPPTGSGVRSPEAAPDFEDDEDAD